MRDFALSIVETARQPLAILDQELRIVAANPPFCRAFQTGDAKVSGSLLSEIEDGRWNLPNLEQVLNGVLAGRAQLEDREFSYVSPSQGRRTGMLSARRIFRDSCDSPNLLLVIEDQTDRDLASEELQRANDELRDDVVDRTDALALANAQLQEANRELEAFCYSVSHDLRAPLRAVDGFSQALLEAYSDKLDDQGQHYLQRIRAGVQRIGQLIDDLLKLSRVTRVELRRERVDLTDLAESIVDELRQLHPDRPVQFAAQPDLAAFGDPTLISVVLENLLENAWKFTGRTDEPVVEFGCSGGPGEPAYYVRDNGAGFDPAFTHKLFGAFQRLHTEREFPGTGIGLATVQRIVHRHGGTCWAEGRSGQGATFLFTLPAPSALTRSFDDQDRSAG